MKLLIVTYDVTDLPDAEIRVLDGEVQAQAEPSDPQSYDDPLLDSAGHRGVRVYSVIQDFTVDLAEAVARGKREIASDIASGRVPREVGSFADLHDHVDANEYGGLCDDYVAWPIDFGNAVQTQLDLWIKSGEALREVGQQTRTILIHLNVEVPADDPRSESEIVTGIEGAMDVGLSGADHLANVVVHTAMAEEV